MTPRMTPDEARKLLGGYATGTLTETESAALFAAALEDQSLFDALAEEDGLRELLETPGAKTRLMAALSGKPATYWFGLPWLTRPRALSFGGLAAMAALTVAFLAQKPAVLPERPAAVHEAAPVEKPDAQPQSKDGAPAASQPARLTRPAELPKDLAKKKTETDETFRDEVAREKSKESGRLDLKTSEAEARRMEPARPAPVPSASTPAAVPPAAPKLADSQAKQESSNVAVQSAPSQGPGAAQFRAGPAPVVQQRQTPSPQQGVPAAIASEQSALQRQEGTIRRQQDASAQKAAGGGATPAAEQKAQDTLAGARGRREAPALAAPQTPASATPLTLRYRLQRAEGGDAPPELTVETSSGFVYILRRTGSGWDTVASGNGPHVLPDAGEYAVVASRVELANPASAIRGMPTDRNLVTLSGNGFTSVSSPESSVAATLRVRVR